MTILTKAYRAYWDTDVMNVLEYQIHMVPQYPTYVGVGRGSAEADTGEELDTLLAAAGAYTDENTMFMDNNNSTTPPPAEES